MEKSNFTSRMVALLFSLVIPVLAAAGGGAFDSKVPQKINPVQISPNYPSEQKIANPQFLLKSNPLIQLDSTRNQNLQKEFNQQDLERMLNNKNIRFSIGTNSGGGGTEKALEFKKVAYDALANLRNKFPGIYQSLQKYELEKYIATVQVIFVDAILDAQIDKYFQESTALNIRAQNTILVNNARWDSIRNAVFREGIALHEILSLKEIEGTGRYPIAEKYVAALGYSPEQFVETVAPGAAGQKGKGLSSDGRCILGFYNPKTFQLCKGERYYYVANPKLRIAYIADLSDFKSPMEGRIKFQNEYDVEVNPLQELGKGEGCAGRPSNSEDNVCVGDTVKASIQSKEVSDLEVLAVFDNRAVIAREKNCASVCSYWQDAFFLSSLEYKITNKNQTYRKTAQALPTGNADLSLDDLCPQDGRTYFAMSDAKISEASTRISKELNLLTQLKASYGATSGFVPQTTAEKRRTCLWPEQFIQAAKYKMKTTQDPRSAKYHADLAEKVAKIELNIIENVPLAIYRPSFFERFLLSADTGVCQGKTIYFSAQSEQELVKDLAAAFKDQGAKIVFAQTKKAAASVTWTRMADKACAEKVERMAWYRLGSEKGKFLFYQEQAAENRINNRSGEIFFNY